MMKLIKIAPVAALAFLASLSFAPTGLASARAQDDDDKDAESKDDDADEDEWFAITNADVHTGTGAVLRGATILAKNGVIEELGYGFHVPEDAERLDARGMRVYPGLVALGATSRISSGLFSASSPEEVGPGTDTHYGLDDHVDPLHIEEDNSEQLAEDERLADEQLEVAELRSKVEDGFDPFSQYLVLALATGITTAEQSSAAIKLRRGEIDGVMMKEKNLATFSWGISKPSSTRGTREKFRMAAEYKRVWEAWNVLSEKKKKEQKEPKKPKGFDASAFKVLTGELLARFSANDREDLYGIARFAQEYGFRPVIFGCREGWTVADELGRAGAYAVVTPRDRSPKSELVVRAGGTSIENAAILHRSGVQVAIRPSNASFDLGGITGRDLLHLPVEAAFGVRGGLSEEAAFASISLVPARILGVDHRVGTLEVGKDLDAIVMNGDVLHYETFVEWAVVAGELVYDKQDEIFFAHIRPRAELPEPVAEPAEEPEEDDGEAGDEDEGPAEGESDEPAADQGDEDDEDDEAAESGGDDEER
jgi:imidazolonepropionase-like amidohydrolase